MARNSVITHEDCVNAIELFDKRARRYERKVSKRGLVLSPELLQKCVIAADNDLYYAKGFRIRDMF